MKPTGPVRVLVVDDSSLFREAIADILGCDPEIEVVALASTAASALGAARQFKPNLITLDLGLPDQDGFAVVRQLMADLPTPIVVLTATLKPVGRKEAFFALSLGALDVMQKPTAAEISDSLWCGRFCRRMKVMAGVAVVPHLDFKVEQRRQAAVTPPRHMVARQTEEARKTELVVMVGSAGSLRAVNSILDSLRSNLPLPVPLVIAMHLGHSIGQSLASFLADDYRVPAQVAATGQVLRSGLIYVAPGGQHLIIENKRFVLKDFIADSKYKPNLDALLHSVALSYGPSAMAVVLSGMGQDGALGISAVRDAGGITLAQKPESCLVGSMPRSAIQAGGVQMAASLRQIAAGLARLRGL